MYVIVRNDLPYSQKCVQSCHAAIETARHFIQPNDEHPSVISVVVRDEKKLKKVLKKLEDTDIGHKAFYEPDIGNQATAIATEPLFGNDRELFRHYQLLQEGGNQNGTV